MLTMATRLTWWVRKHLFWWCTSAISTLCRVLLSGLRELLKVHPVADVETPPTSTMPLIPQGSSKSEKGDPIPTTMRPQQQQQQHAPASRQQNPIINVPPYNMYSNKLPVPPPSLTRGSRNNNCFCRCICWTISLLLLILIIIGATIGIVYLVFKPKIPTYSVDNLSISDLRLNFDLTLYAKFNVRITAINPNEKIGIYYEKGSKLSVWYKSTNLCHGTLPKFYQGHQNKTVLAVSLDGKSGYGNTLLAALQEEQRSGRIPLDLKIDVPVSIKLGGLKLRKVRVLGNCILVVDSLSTNSLITIKTSTCKFRMRL